MFTGMNWADWIQAVLALCTIAATAFVLWRVVPPSWRLLRECLFEDTRWRYDDILKEIVRCVWVFQTYHLYRAVRLRVEYELLTRPRDAAAIPDWKRTLNTELQNLGEAPVIEVDSCFVLYHARAGLRRYFDVLAREPAVPKNERARFLSSVKVSTGFAAPLHLLGGLLAHFEEDWSGVIRSFGAAITRGGDPLPSQVRELQAFLWDCWLLWGPSVPMCTCDRWRGAWKAVQYGYGDENNSVPLVFSDDASLGRLLEQGRDRALAFKTTVTGRPTAPSALDPGLISTAQQNICSAGKYEFVMRYESHEVLSGGRAAEAANDYYSAYVWVMFVLVRPEGARRSGGRQPDWSDLLPFFEHGNVGDATSFEFFKEQVARKALAGIQQVMQLPDVRLEYVCAVDDPGCGGGLFRPFPGRSIKEILRVLLDKEFPDLHRSRQVVVPAASNVECSACHLDEVIERFYDQIKQEGGPAAAAGGRR